MSSKRDRHHDRQALCGGDQLLKLAAPSDPVTGRQLYLLCDRALRLRDEGPEIAFANVGGDDDAALAVLAADLVRARCNIDGCHSRKRDVAHLGQRRIAEYGAHGRPPDLPVRQAMELVAT